jgi:hypothetical protein
LGAKHFRLRFARFATPVWNVAIVKNRSYAKNVTKPPTISATNANYAAIVANVREYSAAIVKPTTIIYARNVGGVKIVTLIYIVWVAESGKIVCGF